MTTEINRRGFIGVSGVAIATAISPATSEAKSVKLGVGGLRTSQLTNPIGLSDHQPSLSWQLAGNRRNIMQSAYRVQVASSVAALRSGKVDLWDSGKTLSSVSTGIVYEGKTIPSRTRAWWQVTVWDDEDISATAVEAAFWERALAPEDWTATWLAAESPEDKADREFGMILFTAPIAPEGKTRSFRLPFQSDAAGDVMLTLFSPGFLRNVTLDGEPVTVDDFLMMFYIMHSSYIKDPWYNNNYKKKYKSIIK